ncbi:MAG: 16S rRNA (cytosine(1402)-N(4))-methyltransferase RsmH [Candidatus Falkowbacteria bacterium]
MYQHVPVMLKEVMDYADIGPGKVVVDCTLGGGGYTAAAARSVGKTGRVLSIDLDELALANARRLKDDLSLENIVLKQGNFAQVAELFAEEFGSEAKADAVFFDLGLSSAQLADVERGFSFAQDGPLDMSFDHDGKTTKSIVNKATETELRRILYEYGEERFAPRIAKAIVEQRRQEPFATSGQLVKLLERVLPASYRREARIHFATRTFQALRIATNEELRVLRTALEAAAGILKSGGRLVVVSFHSLEDRIVKDYFRQESKDCLCPPRQMVCSCAHSAVLEVMTKKPIVASEEEIAVNPRSRSAKLRAAVKI